MCVRLRAYNNITYVILGTRTQNVRRVFGGRARARRRRAGPGTRREHYQTATGNRVRTQPDRGRPAGTRGTVTKLAPCTTCPLYPVRAATVAVVKDMCRAAAYRLPFANCTRHAHTHAHTRERLVKTTGRPTKTSLAPVPCLHEPRAHTYMFIHACACISPQIYAHEYVTARVHCTVAVVVSVFFFFFFNVCLFSTSRSLPRTVKGTRYHCSEYVRYFFFPFCPSSHTSRTRVYIYVYLRTDDNHSTESFRKLVRDFWSRGARCASREFRDLQGGRRWHFSVFFSSSSFFQTTRQSWESSFSNRTNSVPPFGFYYKNPFPIIVSYSKGNSFHFSFIFCNQVV